MKMKRSITNFLLPVFGGLVALFVYSLFDNGNTTVGADVTAFGWTYSNNKADLGF